MYVLVRVVRNKLYMSLVSTPKDKRMFVLSHCSLTFLRFWGLYLGLVSMLYARYVE